MGNHHSKTAKISGVYLARCNAALNTPPPASHDTLPIITKQTSKNYISIRREEIPLVAYSTNVWCALQVIGLCHS